MPHLLLVLAIITAVIEWVAVGKRWSQVEYFAKPGVMLWLLAWLVWCGALQQPNLRWFTLGAFFSLLGDIFLLLPRERLGFGLGLFSFLLAHLSYITALTSILPVLGLHSLVLAVIILALAGWAGRRVLRGLRRKGLRRLMMPVTLYILTLGAMLFCALSAIFSPEWQLFPALLLSAGAASFAISDTLLAWGKFVSHLRYGRVFLMITYHLGQIAILAAAVWQFA